MEHNFIQISFTETLARLNVLNPIFHDFFALIGI